MKILPSVWGSLVVFSRSFITKGQAKYPQTPIQFMDWESHANVQELPDADLIGPTALAVMEVSPQIMEVSFSIGVSSYNDENLFRMRDHLAAIYEEMRPTRQIAIFDSETSAKVGYLVITDGTLLAPMTRAETRPFQYVQATGLLEPTTT